MASSINYVGVCARKGDIPVGTGLPGSEFCRSNSLPLDSSGNAIDGYSLQSSSTSSNGVSWEYQGANGRTIQTYSYPSNCPIPFPSPDELRTDIVQITREDKVVADSGIVDIAMPVLGIQGRVPTHSIPPLCDISNQVVFFFDNANASINVYQKKTQTWRMGWMRGVLTDTFRWRAAALLTQDKIKTASPTYTAPYNAVGLFFSAASSSFTNQVEVRTDNNGSGFFFVNYSVAGTGIIAAWNSANLIEPVPIAGEETDWSVSAIETVRQTVSAFETGSNEAVQVVAAVSVSNNSGLTGGLYGWWGWLARDFTSSVVNFFNPDGSARTTSTPLNFSFKDGDVPKGFVETISYDNNTRVFLGGNYDYVLFDNAVVTQLAAQRAAVAMQYNFTATEMTAANYEFIGPNNAVSAISWTGRVAQSNFADGYFAYGGNFTVPESIIKTLEESEKDVQTFSPYQNVGLTWSFGTTFTANVPTSVRGGNMDTIKFLFAQTSLNLPVTASVDDLGVCVSLVPDNGDVKQGTFPPRFIGGNFLNPSVYLDQNLYQFQTQQPIKIDDWWLSSISIYSLTEVTVPRLFVSLCPITVDPFSADSPYQYNLYDVELKVGLNKIPILAGSDPIFSPKLNSRIKRAASTVNLGLRQTYILLLNATTGGAVPFNIKLGTNDGNGNAYTGCWSLEGYPSTNLDNTGGPGLFSSYALQGGGSATYIQNTAPGQNNGYTLTYNNVGISVPLNTVSYTAYLIPMNTNLGVDIVRYDSADLFVGTPVNDPANAVCTFDYSEDRQGSFKYSCLHNPRIPSVVYEIPTMNSTTQEQPSFSLFMNSRYEIYKTAFAASDDVGFGLYTNFQEITEVQYVNKATASVNPGECRITTGPSVLIINILDPLTNVPYTWPNFIKTGDIVKIKKNSTTEFSNYRINSKTSAPTILIFGLTQLTGSTVFAVDDAVSLTFVLSRNPLQTPFVLKDELGQYLIGNGSDPTTLRDVYLAPFESTGKAYRYLPNYENNFLSFKNGVYVGTPTTDDVLEYNTALFNSNASSVLLTRASNPSNNKWVVSRVTGNVGFNTQIT